MDLSIVVPLYNEEDSVTPLYRVAIMVGFEHARGEVIPSAACTPRGPISGISSIS